MVWGALYKIINLNLNFHHVPVIVVLCMHRQMHLFRQCTFYWDLGNVVWVPVLSPPLKWKKQYGVCVSIQTLLVSSKHY